MSQSIMEIALGLVIAVGIGLTGVGAGIITAPLLIIVFHLPAAAAVGTALTFGAVTKLVIVPVYAMRGQIDFRALIHMLLGGIPGVLAGTLILAHLDTVKHQGLISLFLGLTIIVFASWSLLRLVCPRNERIVKDRPWWLTGVSLPIGAEVGFSSAGSGSLASLALLALTPLDTITAVGTDVCFGLGISLIGGGILLFSGHYDPTILPKLLVGGILGAVIAPNLAALIPGKPLRVGLLVWILFLAGGLIVKGLGH
jgi:uncharacterized protein